ncbi:MAG: hypothetical protein K2O12_01160 [Muribaculaceae bacterium]|nr:hypothetical protein [Muribaculaceae bacterium]
MTTILKIALCAAVVMGFAPVMCSQSRPTREVRMPVETGLGTAQNDYAAYSAGLFISAEASGGYSLNSGRDNLGFSGIDATAGYRFSEFFRVGVGLGARLYLHSEEVRYCSHKWGMPLFLNMRGNFIATDYRDVVPFWSLDAGTTFPDGLMIRPTVGIRVGQQRSAFVLSLGYLGQNIRTARCSDMVVEPMHRLYSFITLKLGYEF